jgi:hypothetical protein
MPLWTTAALGAGVWELVAAAGFGAAFLAVPAVAVDRWTTPFFFFFEVVVGVPSRSAPDSNSAVKKIGKRRIIQYRDSLVSRGDRAYRPQFR